jgi:hypothetical protein
MSETGYSGNPPRYGKVSVSDLIAPPKKVILKIKYPNVKATDISNVVKSAKGTAMHQAMTRALEWYGGYTCELRSEKQVLGWKISGEFDILKDGVIIDLKHASNYSYGLLLKEKQELEVGLSITEMLDRFPTYTKYALQLSLYRWLNQDKDIEPYGDILFMLNDGSNYGKYPIDSKVSFPLFDLAEVEEFVKFRVQTIKDCLDNNILPTCSAAERGFKPAEYKLLRANKSGKMATVRGSKFSNYQDFIAFVNSKGKAGDEQDIVDEKYVFCESCVYSQVCDQ